jgi:nucleoside recognition membrane protein YjiH
MYNLMDSNISSVAALYFILLISFGSFFILNLILAVIMDSYNKIQHKELKEEGNEGGGG